MDINTTRMELLMIQRKMNFKQLAAKADVSRQTLSTVKGRKSCRPDIVGKLARALDVDPSELIETKEA